MSASRQIGAVEFSDAKVSFGTIRITANFVDGYQRILNIESRVFEAFRHDRTRELLPSHDKVELVGLAVLQTPRRIHK